MSIDSIEGLIRQSFSYCFVVIAVGLLGVSGCGSSEPDVVPMKPAQYEAGNEEAKAAAAAANEGREAPTAREKRSGR